MKEYFFQNKIVYVFCPYGKLIADGCASILDANCNQPCGIGGFGP